MDNRDLFEKKEELGKPDCAFCGNNRRETVPISRVIERLDSYLDADDKDAARRHLLYWFEEAKALSDKRGELAVLDEMIGFFRKNGEREEAFKASKRAEELIKELGLDSSVTGATVRLNIATAFKTFSEDERALKYYLEAKDIYERELEPDDARLAGLYNNTALALVALKKYAEARGLYEKSLLILLGKGDAGADMAITHLNMADLIMEEKGLEEGAEEIDSCLEKAQKCLDAKDVKRDGYYAFVCSKCAPSFDYYGHFDYASKLKKRSEEIYKNNKLKEIGRI